jgi:hypothetical protein
VRSRDVDLDVNLNVIATADLVIDQEVVDFLSAGFVTAGNDVQADDNVNAACR